MDKFLKPSRLDADPSLAISTKEWTHWLKTFENFLASLPQEGLNKFDILINFMSPKIYSYVEDCTTYNQAVECLKSLYIKPTNEIYARYVLSTRRQNSGESLDEYLQILKNLGKDCDFKKVSAEQHRDQFIRDAFISGLLSTNIRQRLLENKTLDLVTMFNQARALESAQQSSQAYTAQLPISVAAVSEHPKNQFEYNTPINDIDNNNCDNICGSTSSSPKCYFCGYNKHVRAKCPAREQTCIKCQKKGHFAKVCRSNPSNKSNFTHSASISSTPTLATITSIASITNRSQNCFITLKVNKVSAEALIDSGSDENFIHPKLVESASLLLIDSRKTVLMADSSLSMKTVGYCITNIEIGKRLYNNLKFSVLPNLCADVILGQSFQNLHESITLKYGGPQPPLTVCGLVSMDVKPPELFANLTADCHPIATKSRRYSNDDRKFIDAEVSRMLDEGIIVPSNSPWRAQVLVTRNENHKKRLVIDYSQTINRYTQLDAYPLPKISELVNKIAQYRIFSTIDLKSAYHQVPICKADQKYTAFEANNGLYHFLRIPFGVTNGVACFQRTMDNFIKEEKLTGVFPYLDDVTICGMNKEEHDSNLKKFIEAAERRGITCNEKKCTYSTDKIHILGSIIQNGEIRPDPCRLKPILEFPMPHNRKTLQRALGFFSYYSVWIKSFSARVRPLIGEVSFPLQKESQDAFNDLKNAISTSVIVPVNDALPFVVETDASDTAIAATLSQDGRPVAFYSRTLHGPELNHPSIEKEAKAVIESVRHWRHYLTYQTFTLRTDQKSVAYMFDTTRKSKIKNDKMARWRMELSCFNFCIEYRPGKDNIPADTLSRSCAVINDNNNLRHLHKSLCHPGITRLYHFIKVRNLPYSLEDVKQVSRNCQVCLESKPRFFKPDGGVLIKATQPFERLNVDFKGPIPSSNKNKYFFIAVDEYSRYPFVYPCADMTTNTVIKCLTDLFVLFGFPAYIHSDRGSSFMSNELKSFLSSKSIATSRTTAYNPQCNGQVERYNGIVWKAISLALKDNDLPVECWQEVLSDALHSIRSLLSTATNCTPHERFLGFSRRSTSGISIPTWLSTPGAVLLKRHVRQNKTDPLVDEVELLEATPHYAYIKYPDGRETTVSTRHLAPAYRDKDPLDMNIKVDGNNTEICEEMQIKSEEIMDKSNEGSDASKQVKEGIYKNVRIPVKECIPVKEGIYDNAAGDKGSRRSQRERRPPERLEYSH